MLVVRPVRTEDQAKILELAELAGIGFTSLPPEADVLEEKIALAVDSFAGKPPYEGGETFLFVLEDNASGEIIGTTGIVAHVGLRRPFYSYKKSMIVQASKVVDVYSENRVLHMVNDYTGAAEIGSLFLKKEWRKDGIGSFLSRSRYLMMAEFSELFGEMVIAEIRGVHDDQGASPFYNHACKHFFQMEFRDADFIHATQGGQFIADLMPKYPIYVDLLDKEAQAVIGEPFKSSKPALKLLEREGFSYEGYVDVFDAGPTMQADLKHIKSVAASQSFKVVISDDEMEGNKWIISNTSYEDFRVVFAQVKAEENTLTMNQDAADALRVKTGDNVRAVA